MDPISLIVAALVAGLTAGVQDAAQETVLIVYQSLRDKLSERYGGNVRSSVADLERNPESPVARARVAQRLEEAGATNERELANLATSLMRLIEHPEDALADPSERLRRTGGLSSMVELIGRHIGAVNGVRLRYDVPDDQLMSSRVAKQRQLPARERQELAALHDKMRTIIVNVAASIEETRYRDVDLALGTISGGLGVQQQAAALVRADKDLHVSYETLRLTIEYFSDLNQQAIRNIEVAASIRQESNMMFGNAILLVELTDFVISFVEAFAFPSGVDDLHKAARQKIRDIRARQTAMATRLKSNDEVERTVRDSALSDIRNRESALRAVELEWDKYMSDVGKLRGSYGEVRSKLPTLQVIRENAELQIQTLQLIAMLRFLRQNTESAKGALASLQGFRLVPLSPTRVRRLLGMNEVGR